MLTETLQIQDTFVFEVIGAVHSKLSTVAIFFFFFETPHLVT